MIQSISVSALIPTWKSTPQWLQCSVSQLPWASKNIFTNEFLKILHKFSAAHTGTTTQLTATDDTKPSKATFCLFFRPLNLIKQLSVNIAVMVSGWGLHCPNSSPSCCFDTPNGADVRNKPAPAILCLETTTVTQTPLGNDHLYHLVHIKMFCYSDRFLGLRTGGISVQLLGNGVRGRQQWKADIWVGWREAVRVKQPEKESEPGCETVL